MNIHDDAMQRLGRPNVPDLQAQIDAMVDRSAKEADEIRSWRRACESYEQNVRDQRKLLAEAEATIADALSENERLRIACASGWGEPVLVNTLRAERDAARAEARNALHLMAAWGCRDVLAHEEETCALCRAEHALEEARAERDALLVQVDQWRQMADREVTACVEMRAERDEARLSNTVTEHHTIQQLSAALIEARRVLGRIEWVRIGGKMQPYCPCCWEQAKDGHTADCALAAVLAQEEK